MISTDPWVWVSAFFTIATFSLLWGENPLFRIGEYTYSSTVIAHSVVTGMEVLRGRFTPLFTGQDPMLIVTFALGLMSIFVVWRKYAWLASFPMAIMIGVGTGLSLRSIMTTTIVGNLQATIRDAGLMLLGSPTDQLGFLIRIIFTFCGMAYLTFTLFPKGPMNKPLEYIREVGKYTILIYFGLANGNGFQQQSGLAVSAINRVIKQWLGL